MSAFERMPMSRPSSDHEVIDLRVQILDRQIELLLTKIERVSNLAVDASAKQETLNKLDADLQAKQEERESIKRELALARGEVLDADRSLSSWERDTTRPVSEERMIVHELADEDVVPLPDEDEERPLPAFMQPSVREVQDKLERERLQGLSSEQIQGEGEDVLKEMRQFNAEMDQYNKRRAEMDAREEAKRKKNRKI